MEIHIDDRAATLALITDRELRAIEKSATGGGRLPADSDEAAIVRDLGKVGVKTIGELREAIREEQDRRKAKERDRELARLDAKMGW